MRTSLKLAAMAAVVAVATSWAPVARADDLTDQRDTINAKIAQAKQDISTSSAALSAAVAKLDQSRVQLQNAKAALAIAEAEVAGARAKDAQAAGLLASAALRAEVAGIAVRQGQDAINEQRALIGEVARDSYQQNTTLIGISTLFTANETGQINNRLQWTSTLADTTTAQITRLEDLQAELASARTAQAVLEAQAQTVREEAAARLTATQKAEAKAKSAAEAVAAAVAANAAAKSAADSALAEDQAQYEALQVEAAAVNQRIAERAAAEKAAAEAARKAAEEAARRAPAANQPAPVTVVRSGGLILPVNAPITSPYGMRLHPILGYYRMHDGTDFGAACGTPLRAAANGVVAEAYYSSGYGNRIFIDYGSVNGTVITTAYNHMSGFAASPGQRVSQGQIVGYVGTTGLSTGCHLHLQLWANGTMTNPMNYF